MSPDTEAYAFRRHLEWYRMLCVCVYVCVCICVCVARTSPLAKNTRSKINPTLEKEWSYYTGDPEVKKAPRLCVA